MFTLKNGLCFIDGEFKRKNIIIDGEKIVEISAAEKGNIIDVSDCLLCGSFIDLHTHAREPGYTNKGTIKTESEAAAHGGYTTCFLMPNVKPVPCNRENLELINNIIARDSKIDLHQIASITYDQSGKGNKLSDMEKIKALCVGFSDDGNGVVSSKTMYEAMKIASKLDMPIISHSEDKDLVCGGVVTTGEYGKLHYLPMIDPLSEALEAERNCLLAYKTGCRLHICHVSSLDTVRIVNYYKNLGANITIEVTPHQLTLCDMDIKNSNYKMNPPLSTPDVRDALVEALRNGKIDCISTDHAPHTKEEKEADLLHAPFGIIGLETAFPVLYTDLVKKGHLELKELLILLNKKPAQIMKLKENKLEVGADANIVVVNLENEYEITSDFFKSKATNSPYIGKKVYGRIEKTYYKGEAVYER